MSRCGLKHPVVGDVSANSPLGALDIALPATSNELGVKPVNQCCRDSDCHHSFRLTNIAGRARLASVPVMLAVPQQSHHCHDDIRGRGTLVFASHRKFPVALVLNLFEDCAERGGGVLWRHNRHCRIFHSEDCQTVGVTWVG